MSHNPFNSAFFPYGADLEFFDRGADLMNLESLCNAPRILNYRFISPRGTGKSTLLETFFSFEKCQELAQERKQLVSICHFSGDDMTTNADVFVRLIEAVKDSLTNLDMDSPEYARLSDALQQREKKHPDYRSDPNKGGEILKDMLTYLRSRRYYVTLVLDEFHQLACSQSLADSTFSKMSAISQERLISYIIASDYGDEVGSEDYYISPWSRIFGGMPCHIGGITSKPGKQAVKELIRKKLVRYPEVTFSEAELDSLLQLTGGIPGLLNLSLRDIFEIKLASNTELTPQELTAYSLSACRPLLEKWVQYFDDASWETMAAVIEDKTEAAISQRLSHENDKRTDLHDGGLIVKNVAQQEYAAICPLFASYILSELPRRQKLALAQPELRPEAPQIVHNYYMAEGVKIVQGDDHSQNLRAENVQIQNGLSASDVLRILVEEGSDTRGLFASRLSEQLRKHIPAGGISCLPRGDFATEEAYDQSYDQAFHDFSQQVIHDVEVDEDQDLVITPAEWQTLDERFLQARDRCRPQLTDALLAQQSERCQFYLKLSVVVEDALELPGIQMEDYSPQLVLYGKALEQSLRDNFYELFHKEPTLSVYDTYSNMENSASPDVFANKPVGQTLIGNYVFLMAAKRQHLASLCHNGDLTLESQPGDLFGWTNWWYQLQQDIYTARSIRNLADHADDRSPNRADLNQMCQMLLGQAQTQGILPRTVVGQQLCNQVIEPTIDYAVIQKFVHSDCQIRCTVVKTNGGIKGVTLEGGYPVNISPKRVLDFRKNHNCLGLDLQGRVMTVHILEFRNQDGKDFFSGEILDLIQNS